MADTCSKKPRMYCTNSLARHVNGCTKQRQETPPEDNYKPSYYDPALDPKNDAAVLPQVGEATDPNENIHNNPYFGSGLPAENWRRGFLGERFIGYAGSAAEKFYQEGIAARKSAVPAAAPASLGEAKAVAPYPCNKVAMKCWGCLQQVAPGEGITPTSFDNECYHEECRRLSALTSHPGVPMSVPDDHFKVGNLLRRCSCGSISAEMKVSDTDPVKGAQFWIECRECGAKSSRKPFRAHAGIAWNSLSAAVAQALPVGVEKEMTLRAIAEAAAESMQKACFNAAPGSEARICAIHFPPVINAAFESVISPDGSRAGPYSKEINWAASRWDAEVANRPLVNVHRRTLDDTWRQVIRYFGGDDVSLCGPRHDDLLQGANK